MDNRKYSLSYKKPLFVKNREAIKEIEMVTESIPQLLLQIYIFQKENNIFSLFSLSVIFYGLIKSEQIRSIVTSTFSILFGLIGLCGFKAFFYFERKRILVQKFIHPEKDVSQKIGRFICLMIWYFSIVISRLVLIGLIVSYQWILLILFILFNLIISVVLSKLEKNYFEQRKFLKEFEKEKDDFKKLHRQQYKVDEPVENFIYFRTKSTLKKFLTLFYSILGVYENLFINIEYHQDHFYIPRQTKNYLIFYFLFYIQNITFAIILYFLFNNDLRILLFYAFPFLV